MSFVLFPLLRSQIHPASFIPKFQYSNRTDERGYVSKILRRAKRNDCRIHALYDDETNTFYGFIALSIDRFNTKSALILEYMFVSAQFRGQIFQELGGLTAGGYLLASCVELAKAMSKTAPLKYLALEPADEALARYYHARDFQIVTQTGWMFVNVR